MQDDKKLCLYQLKLVFTWSTDRMTQVASEAAVMALTLTKAGSRTHASKLSVIPSDLMSTPKLDPLAAASSPLPTAPACFCRSLLKMLLASKPALSQRVLGITSKALAIA